MGRVRVLVVGALVGLSACSSSSKSSPSSSVTTSTTAVPSATAKIVSFVVPNATKCGTSTTVTISYSVTGAASQQILIDGLAEPALKAAKGTVSEPVHCDGVLHTAALVATDAQGKHATKVKNFSTVIVKN